MWRFHAATERTSNSSGLSQIPPMCCSAEVLIRIVKHHAWRHHKWVVSCMPWGSWKERWDVGHYIIQIYIYMYTHMLGPYTSLTWAMFEREWPWAWGNPTQMAVGGGLGLGTPSSTSTRTTSPQVDGQQFFTGTAFGRDQSGHVFGPFNHDSTPMWCGSVHVGNCPEVCTRYTWNHVHTQQYMVYTRIQIDNGYIRRQHMVDTQQDIRLPPVTPIPILWFGSTR